MTSPPYHHSHEQGKLNRNSKSSPCIGLRNTTTREPGAIRHQTADRGTKSPKQRGSKCLVDHVVPIEGCKHYLQGRLISPILDSTRHHWHCNWKVTLNILLFIYFVFQFESQCCMLRPMILWGHLVFSLLSKFASVLIDRPTFCVRVLICRNKLDSSNNSLVTIIYNTPLYNTASSQCISLIRL